LARQYVTGRKISAADPLLPLMTAAFESEDEVEGTRSDLAFALAKASEDLKDDKAVFRYLKQANDLLFRAFPPEAENVWRNPRHAMAAFEAGIARSESPPCPVTPGMIFITGMPRSGTTLVEQIVSSHSRVTAGGELGQLQTGLASLLSLAEAQDRPVTEDDLRHAGREAAESYAAMFPDASVLTDKAIFSFGFIGLVPDAMPGSKFIVVRRDPRDNCLSMYKNRFAPGTHRYTTDLQTLARHYLRYLETLEFWRTRCPDAFVEIRYEDLIADPEPQARTLIDACGLGWEESCLRFYENARKVKTLSVYQVRQPLYSSSVGAWKRFETELKPLIDILEAGGALDGFT